jgi:preprotein translocase subunit YajC
MWLLLGKILTCLNVIGGIVSWNQFVVGLSDLVMLAQAEAVPGAADGPAKNTGSPFAQLIPMVGIGVLFYFIVMRPQMKAQKDKRKQHEDLIANLKKNDKVVTIGGILGTVAEVTEDRVTLKIDDNTRIRFTRSSIQEVTGDKKEANKDDTDK